VNGSFAVRGVRTLLVCLTLVFSSVVLTPPTPAAAAVNDDMLALANQMRAAIGAPPLPGDSRVVAAAQNHANYSSANNVGGHFETAGRPYYTGYSARDRVAAMGWSTSFVSEVATGGDALGGVRQLWDAPYHRLGMMHPSASTMGWGHSTIGGRNSVVGDITYNFGIRSVEFVRSPAHGQTNIPTSWSGNESPSPLPAGAARPVGYPIMVVYSGGQNVVMRDARLVAPGGVIVPIYFVPQQFEYDYQVIIPQRPLATNTTYHVRFDITVAGRWLTNEWDFSTGSTIVGGGGSSGGGGVTPAPAPDSGLHSAWVDQTALPAMQPAATQAVTLRFRNSGTKTWTKGVAGSQVALGINGDNTTFAALGMNVGWPSANRVAVQTEAAVPPGGIASFTFVVKAPFSGGLVRIPLRPVIDGVAWLEDQGVVVPVVTIVNYHSRWLTQSPYPTLRAGQVSGPLFISFLNTGSQTWTKGLLGQEARLGVNRDNETWAGLGVGWPSANRVAFQSEASVPPGAVGTFTFQVRAPTTPGLYAINLRPVIDAVTWMEDQGIFLYVTVIP
jgi:hypothetical protein